MFNIKAVIFDIGGVLELEKNINTNGNLSVHEKIAKEFNLSVDQWFDALETPWSKSIKGELSENETIFILSKNLQTTPAKLKKIIISIYKKNFKENKELYDIAFKLKKDGYKIGILSDQWALSKEALIRENYIKKFDKVILSCDAGVRKPDKNAYKKILSELNINAEESVFIDNQIWNIEPAKDLGMKTILYEDNFKTIQKLNEFGVICN